MMTTGIQLVKVRCFCAVDRDSHLHLILITQEFINTYTRSGRVVRIPGVKFMHTLDGKLVHQLDEDNYELVDTGVRITKC